MISKKMQDALNAQINAEMWSAYLYLAMSLDAADKGLSGVAHWFRKQYDEEMEHAFKFVGYMGSQMAKRPQVHRRRQGSRIRLQQGARRKIAVSRPPQDKGRTLTRKEEIRRNFYQFR